MDRVTKLINENDDQDLFLDKWTTFNDDKKPCVFQPFAHSSDSYMYVYRRVDVPEVAFPPTISPENLELISKILKAYPMTNRGRLGSTFRYNNVGAKPSCPATRRDVNVLRDDVMKEIRTLKDDVNALAQDLNALAHDMRTFHGRIDTALGDIIKGLGDQQVALVQLQCLCLMLAISLSPYSLRPIVSYSFVYRIA